MGSEERRMEGERGGGGSQGGRGGRKGGRGKREEGRKRERKGEGRERRRGGDREGRVKINRLHSKNRWRKRGSE